MNFSDAENYLFSLGNEVAAMKLGLKNIRKLMASLGNPQNNYLKVQVAGTNGKGSVCAFLDAICLSAGIKTGLFTSPHLISIRERVRINGSDIGKNDFARFATVVRESSERLVAGGELESAPTYFEQVTAIALLAFGEAKAELAILETGLGGRLDATTAANAEIAAITRIDIDHQEYLGETLREIAAEKAAIIHGGSRVVIGHQQPEAMQVIRSKCAEFGVKAIFAGEPDIAESRNTAVTVSNRFESDVEDTHNITAVFPSLKDVSLGLKGRHQIENALIAVHLAKLLQENLPITSENIVEGLQNARHPGRLEFDGKYLFDGAHNAAGINALRKFLDENVLQPMIFIFGATKEKNVRDMAASLFRSDSRVIVTQPANTRAMTARAIEAAIARTPDQKIFATTTVESALAKADDIWVDGDLIVVTGSLYLVGEAKKILKDKSQI